MTRNQKLLAATTSVVAKFGSVTRLPRPLFVRASEHGLRLAHAETSAEPSGPAQTATEPLGLSEVRAVLGGPTTPPGVQVKYRRMDFGLESAGFDKRWHRGSAFISYFWNALSSSFPPGERFFVEAANSVRPQVDDPELLAELDEFVRQEGHHAFHHRRFNALVGEQGLDMARLEKRFSVPLEAASEGLRPMQKLAVTVALEHFTAVLSHHVLKHPELLEGADPKVAAMFLWHFSEELEHKATCFALYERLGGRYRTRLKASRLAWTLELGLTFRNLLSMLREDGRLFDVADHVRGLWYLFGPRGLLTGMLPELLTYFGPKFQPWQVNDSHLISEALRASAPYLKRSPSPSVRPAPLHGDVASVG
jgi:predicted metal-dependent hydrolase